MAIFKNGEPFFWVQIQVWSSPRWVCSKCFMEDFGFARGEVADSQPPWMRRSMDRIWMDKATQYRNIIGALPVHANIAFFKLLLLSLSLSLQYYTSYYYSHQKVLLLAALAVVLFLTLLLLLSSSLLLLLLLVSLLLL